MLRTSLLALLACLPACVARDEPKPFLVVETSQGQVVADMTRLDPHNNDHQRSIDRRPAPGIIAPTGDRRAYAAEVEGHDGRAIFVVDLAPGVPSTPPHRSSGAIKGLELLGWAGRRRVLIADRESGTGVMLRIVDARLEKDSTFAEGRDVTDAPGEYTLPRISAKNDVAYFAPAPPHLTPTTPPTPPGNRERGSVIVWSDGVRTIVAERVAATAMCWSPGADRLAVAEPGAVTVYDRAGAGKPVSFALPPAKDGDVARIVSMAWRPDGGAIALLPDWPRPDHPPGNPRVWSLDVATGACTIVVQLTYTGRTVRWLSDTGCDTTLDEACESAAGPVWGQRP